MPKLLARECLICGTAFTTYPSLNKRYCRKSCADIGRRKDKIKTVYRMVYAPDHPLVVNSPYIPEHRRLLWDKIGPGTHPCYHCQKPVTWKLAPGRDGTRLFVDHLDQNGHNNDPANLVPACQSCNSRNHGRAIQDGERHRIRPGGKRLRGEPANCKNCGAEFLKWPGKRPGDGQFCSPPCHYAYRSKTVS